MNEDDVVALLKPISDDECVALLAVPGNEEIFLVCFNINIDLGYTVQCSKNVMIVFIFRLMLRKRHVSILCILKPLNAMMKQLSGEV